MGVFISHAEADKVLVESFLDTILQNGIGIAPKDIFCTSVEGFRIPEGKSMVEFIRKNLELADTVIMLITPRYYESAFCLCELGGTWALMQDSFPLIVPPIDFTQLQAVLEVAQVGKIEDKHVLSRLRDRLVKKGIGSKETDRWEVKRDTFLKGLPKILKQLPERTQIPYEEFTKLQKTYDSAQDVISEHESRIEELKEMVEKLKQCKDRDEVTEIVQEYSTVDSQLHDLIQNAKDALRALPHGVSEVLYYEAIGKTFILPNWNFYEDYCDSLEKASEQKYLNIRDEVVSIPESRCPIRLRDALEKLDNLRQFIYQIEREEDNVDYLDSFEREYGYSLDYSNRDFWSRHLGVYFHK